MSAEVLRSPEVDMMLPHKFQKEGKNCICSLPGAPGHYCWLLFNSLSSRPPMSFPTKVPRWQLISACRTEWCYPALGVVLLPLLDFTDILAGHFFWPVPLSSSPAFHSVRHSPSLVLFTHLLSVLSHHPGNSFDNSCQSQRDTAGSWLPIELCTCYQHPQAKQSDSFSIHLFVHLVRISWWSYREIMSEVLLKLRCTASVTFFF